MYHNSYEDVFPIIFCEMFFCERKILGNRKNVNIFLTSHLCFCFLCAKSYYEIILYNGNDCHVDTFTRVFDKCTYGEQAVWYKFQGWVSVNSNTAHSPCGKKDCFVHVQACVPKLLIWIFCLLVINVMDKIRH